MKGFVSSPLRKISLDEVFSTKHLVFEFMRRDFKVRYKQTFLGFLWAIINPGVNIFLYIFVFGLLVKVQTPEYQAPYSAVLITGIIFWNLFSSCLISVSDSLINNMHLITKVYFPRVALCFACALMSLVDFFIAVVVFIPIVFFLNVEFDICKLLFIVPCIVLTLMLSCGLGFFMAILKLKYRDIRHTLPLFLQILFFASPIVYTLSLVPQKFIFLYYINPISGIVMLSRWAILGGDAVNFSMILSTSFISLIVFFLGFNYFCKNDANVVDYE